MRNYFAILATVALVAAHCANATPVLYAATPYNVFVLSNFTQKGSDTQGGIAAGGTITIGSGESLATNIASLSPFTGDYTVVAGSALVFLPGASGSSDKGNLYSGSPVTVPQSFTINNGSVMTGPAVPEPIDFSATFTQLNNLSRTLASQAPTGSCVKNGGQVTCTATGTGTNYIDLDPSLFASGFGETITAPAGSTLVLNILGGTIPALTNSSFTFNGISASNVILNIPSASQFNLVFQSSFPFSVLAPEANVSFNSNGAFQGTLIANGVNAVLMPRPVSRAFEAAVI
jgi:choice-of-anchor A domain-containing protein